MDVVLNKLVNLDLGGKTITGNVSMTSATTGTIDIKNGTITGDLTVNAENATVNNSATVNGTITIADVSSGTWNQKAAHTGEIVFNATGKTLNVSANVGTLTINKKATVTVDEGKTVSDIAVADTAADTAITNNGTVSSMTINAKATVTSATKIKATIKDAVEVVVKETAEDTGNTVTGTGAVVEDIKEAALAEAKETKIATIDTEVPSTNYVVNKKAYDAKVTEVKAAINDLGSLALVAEFDVAAQFAGINTDDEMYSIVAGDELAIGDKIVINAKGATNLRVMLWANKSNEITDIATAKGKYYHKVTSARFTDLASVVEGDTFTQDGDKFTVTITQNLLAAIKGIGEENGTVTNSPHPDTGYTAIEDITNLTFIFTPENEDGFFNEFETWDGSLAHKSLQSVTIK